MIYLDNTATTPLLPEVIDEMNRIFKQAWGNPSSIHSIGQIAKAELESARNTIASVLSAKSSEIYFTASATEGIGLMIPNIIKKNQIQHIITSPIEHSAVLKTIQHCESVEVHMLDLDKNGAFKLSNLEDKLSHCKGNKLVVLMHANNEIGTLLPFKKVSELCLQYEALLFCDMVQTIGKYDISFSKTNVDFAVASAHKFHGPKGAGILYIKSGRNYPPMIFGGGQEREMRSGTENVPAIAGMAKAIELAKKDLTSRSQHIQHLKSYFTERIKEEIPDIKFNGNSQNGGLYTLINISLPLKISPEVLNMKLDMAGLSASQGSACSSGVMKNSSVIQYLYGENRNALRLSFSFLNTIHEIEQAVDILKNIVHKK
ncbi:MAG: cysteine desulfurase family protein [Bacteroidales bacterium]|nr:cysteine desulfurase family protein [Bacteroidales bacterium]